MEVEIFLITGDRLKGKLQDTLGFFKPQWLKIKTSKDKITVINVDHVVSLNLHASDWKGNKRD